MSGSDIVVAVLLLGGVSLALLAAVGLQQFEDVFARMHAATKPATLGLVLILAAAALKMSETDDTGKLLLVVVMQFITAPVGAHMVGRAAFNAGTELNARTEIDDLCVELLGLRRKSE